MKYRLLRESAHSSETHAVEVVAPSRPMSAQTLPQLEAEPDLESQGRCRATGHCREAGRQPSACPRTGLLCTRRGYPPPAASGGPGSTIRTDYRVVED